ncbi:MAG TPA: PfkB family carbohydrate kinase [Actinomycetota bacterium]|nr:PfkB family carbohydrate kinase [Actinomycetota bacterium]
MRVAVVGHVEWVRFARVEGVPSPGEIVHASEWWEEPAGGGAVAAVQLARLAGLAVLFTALGDDEPGHRARRELEALGLRVETTFRPTPQRQAFTFVDASGERTITVMGERMGPSGDDPLDWEELEGADAVYFTAGDRRALERARRARVLVATLRAQPVLSEARVVLDALVGSARDPAEAFDPVAFDPPPGLLVQTEGRAGGRFVVADGRSGRYEAVPPPGPVRDTYGCGDSFAAGLTYGLGAGLRVEEALALAARCGAACLTGRGAYEGQLRLSGEDPRQGAVRE